MHAGCFSVEHLHPVHADVPLAVSRVVCKYLRQSDEPPAVLRPALDNRQIVEIRFLDNILRRSNHDISRPRRKKSSHHRMMFKQCSRSRGHSSFKKRNELFAERVRMVTECKFNTALARQRVDDKGISCTLHSFKQECWFLSFQRAGCDLGNFENGVDFYTDAVEFAVFFEVVDKFTKGSKTHTSYSNSSFRQPFDSRSPITPRSLLVKAATYSWTVFRTK